MGLLGFIVIECLRLFVTRHQNMRFLSPTFMKPFILLQSGIRIITSRQNEQSLGNTETEIIENIHKIRYSDNNSYVTTGGHFSQLYVRNLGIFLNALLDPRIPTSDDDWRKRQQIAIRTVALDLEIFKQAGKTYTTIVPLGNHLYTAMNIYTEPSDALFGIIYTLCALSNDSFIPSLFPSPTKKIYKLQTVSAAKNLIEAYKPTISNLLKGYKNYVLDEKTGLIKKNILLASARDGIRRESSFYDNVICWATLRLANDLKILLISKKDLEDWKKRIIDAFWDEKQGILIDDLSGERNFSADAFIVTSSGFLDTKNKQDTEKLVSMIDFVQKEGFDKPFPLRYSKTNHLDKLYWPVRLAAPAYMGESIWSHWGMEYIKSLILLGKHSQAKIHLNQYKQNIESNGGYPELYDTYGKLYKTSFYKGVLHNSWVINYEQAKMMLGII